MALSRGRTPLPGSPAPLETTLTNADTDVAKTSKPSARFSLFTGPGKSITAAGTDGTDTDSPSLRKALGNVHPVRDTLKAVQGVVKKALGKKDNAESPSAPTAEA